MKRIPCFLAAIVALFFAAHAHVYAASTAQQKIASVQYLVGTWTCRHTVGGFSGTYTTTYANALSGLWLKQTYDFPAKQMSDTSQPAQAEYFIGYDEGRQGWVRFGAMTTGQYFAIRMMDTDSGWSWKYVGFFRRKTPETPGSDATFTKRSDSEYAVDGPSYPLNGTTVTEHHVCTKQ